MSHVRQVKCRCGYLFENGSKQIKFVCPVSDSFQRVCEDDTLKIDCHERKKPQFTGVMYGRQSKKYCKTLGMSMFWWSKKCRSTVAPQKLQEICDDIDGRGICTVKITNENLGGDPCRGTRKYIEVDYTCVDNPKAKVVNDLLKKFASGKREEKKNKADILKHF